MRVPAVVLGVCLLGAPDGSVTPAPDERSALATLTISGLVSSPGGAPLEGVSVQVGHSRAGQLASARTDLHGRYILQLSRPDSGILALHFRRIGYDQVNTSVRLDTLRADSVRVNVTLTPMAVALQEIVVTGVGGGIAQRSLGASVIMLRRPGAVAGGTGRTGGAGGDTTRRWNTEEYDRIEDNPFLAVAAHQRSTFSVDVDRAAYANVRRFVRSGQLPVKDAVRVEELVNYFPYSYAAPAGREPVAITADLAEAPWNRAHHVVRIGLQAPRIDTKRLPPSNLVFLLDVSGSMTPPNKLPLVKQAFRLLVDELRPQDRVAIVVYAGAAGLVLPSTPASEKDVILAAIGALEAGGSTAGGAGIRLAYDVARANFIKGGNNRVILATDGDFNIGVSSTSELVRLVEERRQEGTFLTVLGFGMGNVKDSRMEQMADKGNGNYAYVDDLLEAKKVFVHEMGATLFTVAKDVKLQVEFNPATVQAYRLIGYENRLLRDEDFTDDRKDAGEMGAGHSVTALYEVVLAGQALDVSVGSTPPLRYGRRDTQRSTGRVPRATDELLTVSVRYKDPDGSESRQLQRVLRARTADPDADFRFAMAVAGYGMRLRSSPHAGTFTLEDVRSLAAGALGDDRGGYRRDFLALVDATQKLALAAK